MKKTLIAALAIGAVTLSSQAQGYFNFSTAKNFVYDVFTTQGTSVVAPGTVKVGFIWTTGSTTLPFSSAGQPISATTPISGLTWGALSTLTTSGGWTWAVNNGSSALATVNDTAAGVTKGNINYNGSASFQVTGTPSGGNVSVIMVGWDANYATPQLASAAGAALGVSDLFTYADGASSGSPISSFGNSGATPFGVVAAVPEPTTIALAGLGGLGLMALRRKK